MIYANQYCKCCGAKIKNTMYRHHLCRTCHDYLKHDQIYDIPPKGIIKHVYGEYGYKKEICHICGKAFKSLPIHTKAKHHTHYQDYKKLYRLP